VTLSIDGHSLGASSVVRFARTGSSGKTSCVDMRPFLLLCSGRQQQSNILRQRNESACRYTPHIMIRPGFASIFMQIRRCLTDPSLTTIGKNDA
jgi:hypothetical protein